MGCKHRNDNCICEILSKIAARQQDLDENCCDVSCEKSINMLSPTTSPQFDTIPFAIAYQEDNDCDRYLCGEGFFKHNDSTGGVSEVHSSYFRIKKMLRKEGNSCCAVLELLYPVPCEENVNLIGGFRRTGVCITVDLDCICTLTCFPPVRAPRASASEIALLDECFDF